MVVKLWFNMKNDGINSEYQRDQDIYVESTCCNNIPCPNSYAIKQNSSNNLFTMRLIAYSQIVNLSNEGNTNISGDLRSL